MRAQSWVCELCAKSKGSFSGVGITVSTVTQRSDATEEWKLSQTKAAADATPGKCAAPGSGSCVFTDGIAQAALPRGFPRDAPHCS